MEIDHLKSIPRKNNYLLNFTDSCIMSFLNDLFTAKVSFQVIPKRDVFNELMFLGSTLFQIRKKLQKLVPEILMSCNLKSCFYISNYVQDFYTNVTNVSVGAAMPPVMVRPNAILKSEFVII